MIPKHLIAGVWHDRPRGPISQSLLRLAAADAVSVLERLETCPEGLTDEEAAKRLDEHGQNVLAKDTRAGFLTLIGHAVLNPLVILLAILASISFATGDARAGTMMAVMIATGQETYLGVTASSLTEDEPPTSFDKGIQRFTWLILRFVVVMVPLVFLINGFTKGNWHEAFFFAVVGISVDTAVDIAKASADMILLEKSLLVLEAGVVEGRRVSDNILKCVPMGASSNFGNMFSVFIGPCSSLFDYTTYFMMLYVFTCWDTSTPEVARQSASLFQTGWFVESLLTQTLIIDIIRTDKLPFLQSRPSWPLDAAIWTAPPRPSSIA